MSLNNTLQILLISVITSLLAICIGTAFGLTNTEFLMPIIGSLTCISIGIGFAIALVWNGD